MADKPGVAPLAHAFLDFATTRSSLECSGYHTNVAWAFASGTGVFFLKTRVVREVRSHVTEAIGTFQL